MSEKLSEEKLINFFNTVKIVPFDNHIPFPIVKDFNKIIIIGDELVLKNCSLPEISEKLGLSLVDSEDYANAAVYLDLIDPYHEFRLGTKKTFYRLSESGRIVFSLSGNSKILFLCKSIFQKRIFNQVFKEYIKSGSFPSDEKIIDFISKDDSIHHVDGVDVNLEVEVVKSWLNWIINLYK